MSTKPTTHAEWDTNGTNLTATTSGHKSDGWANNEIPTAGEFNHWQKQVSDWTKWLYDGDCAFNALSAVSFTMTPPSESSTVQLLKGKDWQGTTRATIDHLGFRGGQLSEWEEHWRTTTAPDGWTWTQNAGATVVGTDPDTNINQRYALITTPNTGNATCFPLYTAYLNANTMAVAEWVVRTGGIVATDSSNTYHDFGFQLGSAGSDNDFVMFRHKADNTTWRAFMVVDGIPSPATGTDTTVTVTNNTTYRMRLEVIGSALYSGGGGQFLARFFINGVLTNSIPFTTPAADKIRFQFRSSNNQATTCTWAIGRVRMQWNHFLTSDAV